MKERMIHLLEKSGLPADALCDCARVTMTGRTSVMIEGQHGVIELTAQRIRLRTGEGIMRISGNALRLQALAQQQTVISGRQIDEISYLR